MLYLNYIKFQLHLIYKNINIKYIKIHNIFIPIKKFTLKWYFYKNQGRR